MPVIFFMMFVNKYAQVDMLSITNLNSIVYNRNVIISNANYLVIDWLLMSVWKNELITDINNMSLLIIYLNVIV